MHRVLWSHSFTHRRMSILLAALLMVILGSTQLNAVDPAETSPNTADSASKAIAPPTLSEAARSLHGTIAGEPFWLAITGPDQRYNGHRVAYLLYTQPDPQALGTVLTDHPRVLLDEHLNLIAWDERGATLSGILHRDGTYAIEREQPTDSPTAQDDSPPTLDITQASVVSAPAWSATIAWPILAIALQEHAAGSAEVLELFSAGEQTATTARWHWHDGQLIIGETPYTIERTATELGQVVRITDADGNVILEAEPLPFTDPETPPPTSE